MAVLGAKTFGNRLWRPARAPGCTVLHWRERNYRPDWAEWCGENDGVQSVDGCVCSHGGDHHPRKPEHCWEKDVPDHTGGDSRTFSQNIRLFKDISVIDNVKIAMNFQMKYSVLSGIFRLPAYRREEAQVARRAHELLQVFNLDEKVRGSRQKSPLWTAAQIGDCPCACN